MDTQQVEKAQLFIWMNARLLERQLFAYLFAGGSRQAVISALKAYQNPDGGFGNALEPDKRSHESQPVDAEVALQILDMTGAYDEPQVCQDMILPLCDFLQSITTPEGGIPLVLPSVRRYPRAPWWDTGDNPPASINPTASIAGLLIKHGIQHPWLEGAMAYCWKAVAASESTQVHDLMPMIAFLENAPNPERAGKELERIVRRIHQAGVVALERQAPGYVQYPTDWAPVPSSFGRSLVDVETMSRHLAYLSERQQPDGGWPLIWEPISPAVGLEWRGWLTVQALRTLQAYETAQVSA